MTTLGQYITSLRDEKGWTQRELAKRAGCSHTTINKLEGDAFKQPSLDLIIALSRAFKVPVASFVRAYQGKEPNFKEMVDKESLKHSLNELISTFVDEHF